MKRLVSTLGFALATLVSAPAWALIGFADVVVDFVDSGAGPMAGPYGGLGGVSGAFPVAVPLSVVLGSDVAGSETFLSLPTGSSVTVRFTDEIVIDGVGNDIFIQEIGASGEDANVFVSSDGLAFTFLGLAQDDVTTSFDLGSIGFADPVRFVRIVGLDNGGGSPGFDVVNVQGLPGSVRGVPEPGTAVLLGLALLTAASLRARRRS